MAHDLEVGRVAKDAIMASLSIKLKIRLLYNALHENMDSLLIEQPVAAPLLAVGR